MRKTVFLLIRIFIFLLVPLSLVYGSANPSVSTLQTDTVWRVIDGDTLKLVSDQKIRLIGVDAPEATFNRKAFLESRRTGQKMRDIKVAGKITARYMKRLVEGKPVRIEFDLQKRDKYGKLLAYVYLADGTFVNAKWVEEGYGVTMPMSPNFRYKDLFERLQKEAKQQGKGFWAHRSLKLTELKPQPQRRK